jgi:hypothetical protein
MNFFSEKATWTNAELIPLKLCIASAYVLVGGYFHNIFGHYYIPALALFGVSAGWSVYMWLKKMKAGNKVSDDEDHQTVQKLVIER